jgi:hypothetical protein
LVKAHIAHQQSLLAHRYQVNRISWAQRSTTWMPTNNEQQFRTCTNDHQLHTCTPKHHRMALLPTQLARTPPLQAPCQIPVAPSTLPLNLATRSAQSTPSVHFPPASLLHRTPRPQCPRQIPGNTTTTSVHHRIRPTRRRRSATSARPATRPSHGPQVSKSTVTHTPERSRSSALT